MNNAFVNLLVRWIVLALGVALAAQLVPGLRYDTGGSLLAVVILLSVFNAVLKPLLVLFSLPFIVLSLGIGLWLINALLLLLVGELVKGFHVAGFGSALLGALIISVTTMVVNHLLGRSARPEPRKRPERRPDDVIDV